MCASKFGECYYAVHLYRISRGYLCDSCFCLCFSYFLPPHPSPLSSLLLFALSSSFLLFYFIFYFLLAWFEACSDMVLQPCQTGIADEAGWQFSDGWTARHNLNDNVRCGCVWYFLSLSLFFFSYYISRRGVNGHDGRG